MYRDGSFCRELVRRTERPPTPEAAENCQGDLRQKHNYQVPCDTGSTVAKTLKEARGLALETVKLSTHQKDLL